MGDAKSLLGGTLLVTPLMGADGQAYAVAQGTVQTGSVSASGASGSAVAQGRADRRPHRRRAPSSSARSASSWPPWARSA